MKLKTNIKKIREVTWLWIILICNQVPVLAFAHDYSCSGVDHLYQTNVSSDRLNDYDVSFYKLEIAVSDTSTYIEGFTTIKALCVVPDFSEMVLELSNVLTVDSVYINGGKQNFVHEDNLIKIETPTIKLNSLFETTVYYKGDGENSAWISGILSKKSTKWDKNITYTLSEPFGAKDWFACKQVLSDKADSVAVNIIVDDHLMAGSNGLLTKVTSLPGNKLRYEWKSTYPITYYLISLAVSDYLDYSFYTKLNDKNDSVLVQNFVYNDSLYLKENKSDIDKTSELLVLFSDLYGIYPFYKEKYGHCVAPLGGGMENQTMTSLSGFNFDLVAHELAHQWFGDYVTCATWQDIWVNEGFASYSEYLAREFLKSKEEAASWLEMAYTIVKSNKGGSVYIPASEVDSETRIFSQRLTYKKGAAIVHMLRYELNDDDLFFDILKTYMSEFKDSVATGEDFLEVLNRLTGSDYNWFFNQWFYGEGIPQFDFLWQQKKDTLIVNSIQTNLDGDSFFKTSLEFRVNFDDNTDTVVRVFQESASETFKILIPYKLVSSIDIDPENNILKTVLSNSKMIDPELEDNYFYAHPNPFDTKLMLNFKTFSEHHVTIIDSLGNVVDRLYIDDRKQKINTTGFSSGIYFIIVENNRSTHAQKVIKY